jgi:hypothetical protein
MKDPFILLGLPLTTVARLMRAEGARAIVAGYSSYLSQRD